MDNALSTGVGTAGSRRLLALTDLVEDPHFRIMVDDQLGIVRTGALTFRHGADVDRYIAVLTGIFASVRRRFGRALVLADLRDAPIRSQEAADRLRMHNGALYRPGERVALLVASSLLKLQLRRTLVPEYQNIFMSEAAAETWLLAARHGPAIEEA